MWLQTELEAKTPQTSANVSNLMAHSSPQLPEASAETEAVIADQQSCRAEQQEQQQQQQEMSHAQQQLTLLLPPLVLLLSQRLALELLLLMTILVQQQQQQAPLVQVAVGHHLPVTGSCDSVLHDGL
jgi:hypothetical protein